MSGSSRLETLASLDAEPVFGARAPWSRMLFFNGSYAIAAMLAEVFGTRTARAPAA